MLNVGNTRKFWFLVSSTDTRTFTTKNFQTWLPSSKERMSTLIGINTVMLSITKDDAIS